MSSYQHRTYFDGAVLQNRMQPVYPAGEMLAARGICDILTCQCCSTECWKEGLTCGCCTPQCWANACCVEDITRMTDYCGCACTAAFWKDTGIGALRFIGGVATIVTPTFVALGNGSYYQQPPYINTAVTIAYSICLGVSLLHAMYSIKKNCCRSEPPPTRCGRFWKFMDPCLTISSFAITSTVFVSYVA